MFTSLSFAMDPSHESRKPKLVYKGVGTEHIIPHRGESPEIAPLKAQADTRQVPSSGRVGDGGHNHILRGAAAGCAVKVARLSTYW